MAAAAASSPARSRRVSDRKIRLTDERQIGSGLDRAVLRSFRVCLCGIAARYNLGDLGRVHRFRFPSEERIFREIDGEWRRPGSAALRRERADRVPARRPPCGNHRVGRRARWRRNAP